MSLYLRMFNACIVLIFLFLFEVDAQEEKQQYVIAPAFSVQDIYGENIALVNQLEDKPVMLYFWATWCPFCKKETPRLVEFYNKFAEKINVIGVNVDVNNSVEKINDYINEFGVRFPIIYDIDHLITPAYRVDGTPVFVVISQSQHILYRGHRFPAGIEQALGD